MAEQAARTFINSGRYAERLGAHPVVFRQAMAHKRGTLGSRGGTGYAPPGVKELAQRIAPPTMYAGGGGKARPLWSLAEVEAFEAETGRSGSGAGGPGADGRGRRPAGLKGFSDAEVEGVLEDGRAALTKREAEILRARLGLDRGGGATPRPLGSVGEELGISREWVRQVESRAVEKVREALAGGAAGAAS